jgi:hypothetical protein
MPIQTIQRFGAVCIAALVLAMTTGCTSKVSVRPYEESSTGLSFMLPKTLLQLKITYTGTTKSCPKKPISTKVTVEKPIEYSTVLVGDPSHSYVIDTTKLSSANVEVKEFKVALNENGYITDINAAFNDKTAEIAKGILTTGINVAKLVTTAGKKQETTPDCKEEKKEITVIRLIDPTELSYEKVGDHYEATYEETPKIKELFENKAEVVPIKFVFIAKDDIGNTGKAPNPLQDPAWKMKENGHYVDALPYRKPTPLLISFIAKGQERERRPFVISQAGKLSFLPITSKAFADRKTSVKFSPNTGGVTEYSFSTTSSGERLATTLADTSGTLVTEINKLKFAEIDNTIAQVNKETELIDAQAKNEESKNKLKKILDKAAGITTTTE